MLTDKQLTHIEYDEQEGGIMFHLVDEDSPRFHRITFDDMLVLLHGDNYNGIDVEVEIFPSDPRQADTPQKVYIPSREYDFHEFELIEILNHVFI